MRRDRASMGMGVDKDLTMEERRLRWRMVEAVRQERAKRRRAVTNRELWVDVRGWRWNEVKQCWKAEKEKSEVEQERKEGNHLFGREQSERNERGSGERNESRSGPE